MILDGLRELLSIVIALAAVSLLAWGAIWVMKRLQTRASGAPGAADDLRFVRALPLGPRERLVVVEWRGETLLLGVTAGGITLVSRDVPETSAASGQPLRSIPRDVS